MPTITVMAPDSALAMDEVVRQLGDGAYILSTTQQDGMIRIKATNDPMNSAPKRNSLVHTVYEDEEALHVVAGEPQEGLLLWKMAKMTGGEMRLPNRRLGHMRSAHTLWQWRAVCLSGGMVLRRPHTPAIWLHIWAS